MNNTPHIQGVVFDLDGLMVNSEEILPTASEHPSYNDVERPRPRSSSWP